MKYTAAPANWRKPSRGTARMHLWGNLPDGQLVAVLEWLYDRRRARREEALKHSASTNQSDGSHQPRPPKGEVLSMERFRAGAREETKG